MKQSYATAAEDLQKGVELDAQNAPGWKYEALAQWRRFLQLAERPPTGIEVALPRRLSAARQRLA
jgi:hypothetical protein